MVPPASHKVSRVSWYSGSAISVFTFRLQDSHPLRSSFPACSTRLPLFFIDCPQPLKPQSQVWALTFSLAATWVIDFSFSSSGYLDVSVHLVPLLQLCIHYRILTHYSKWVSPFGHLRICAHLQLPEAYRSLSRPSSALSAKASTLCSY